LTKYTKNETCANLVSFTRLHRDAWSTERKRTKIELTEMKNYAVWPKITYMCDFLPQNHARFWRSES